ncbi:6-hydroxynicotinate 3-monooxygenase [Cyphellophora attinorum]|uniref:6-hydroxynicotinate 3-monooxygenase n=1 Tax=Cyphellophora attinorum TaxID=1664694 RepID=A0A0N1P4H0_9EURO|nr:6-hydroxynicotinate 3-monooxygenase [Phialophora attinorum]KPI45752.1 6-hydroxynicotinate 3-monooxygenase [Phialophora attinorum]
MTLHVAIIGAGIAGPTLALHLQSHPSITTTIYEARPHGSIEEGQHISLAPNALRVLSHIGVSAKLNAIGNSYEELGLRNAAASKIAEFDNGSVDRYGFTAMRIHRRHVARVLVEECEQRGVRMRWGVKLKGLVEREDGRVEMRFAEADGKGVKEVADLVVGADGLHSVVREYVNPGSESVFEHMLGVTGYLQRSELGALVEGVQLPSHFIGKNGFMAIMPSDVAGEEIGFFSTMEFPQERTRGEWRALYDDKEQIRQILKDRFNAAEGWCDLVSGVCEVSKAQTLCSWPFFIAPPMPRWRSSSDRVIILGDAAHAMIPTGGLGASLALEDAECLSQTIRSWTDAKLDRQALHSRMEKWEAHRRERLALVQDFTNKNRWMRAAGGTWAFQYLKEWFMWAFFKFVGSGGQADPIYRYDAKIFAQSLSDSQV